jgi:hypothetical protein
MSTSTGSYKEVAKALVSINDCGYPSINHNYNSKNFEINRSSFEIIQ